MKTFWKAHSLLSQPPNKTATLNVFLFPQMLFQLSDYCSSGAKSRKSRLFQNKMVETWISTLSQGPRQVSSFTPSGKSVETLPGSYITLPTIETLPLPFPPSHPICQRVNLMLWIILMKNSNCCCTIHNYSPSKKSTFVQPLERFAQLWYWMKIVLLGLSWIYVEMN